MNFSNYLIYLREKRGINKTELARKLGLKNSSYIINVESGHSNPPTAKRLEEISSILRLSDSEKKKLFDLAFQEKIVKKSPEWFDMQKESLQGKYKDISPFSKVPIISWVKANRFEDISDPFSPGESDDYITTTIKGENMFGLKVSSNCMEPEFREGDIIIINPKSHINNGDYVVVKNTKSDQATFKQYKVYGKKIILHPLNPAYEDIELDQNDGGYQIVGKVVEKVKKY